MGYHDMKRRDLQALCKKHNLPANGTNLQMADSLTSIQMVQEKGRTSLPSCLKGGSGESAGESAVNKKVSFSLEQEKLETVINVPDVESEGNLRGKRKRGGKGSKIQQTSVPKASKTGLESKSKGSHEEIDDIEEISVRSTRSRAEAEISVKPASVFKKQRGKKSRNSEEVDMEIVQEDRPPPVVVASSGDENNLKGEEVGREVCTVKDTAAKIVSMKRGKKTGNKGENEIEYEEKKVMGETEAAGKEKLATRSLRRRHVSSSEVKIPPVKQIDTGKSNSNDSVAQEISDVRVIPQGAIPRKTRRGVQQLEKKDETSEVENDGPEGIDLQKVNKKTRSTNQRALRTRSGKSSTYKEIQLGDEVSGAGKAEFVTGSRVEPEEENIKVEKIKEAPGRTRGNASKKEVSVRENKEREAENLTQKIRTSKRSRDHASEKEASVGENGTVPEIVDETGVKNKQEEVSKNEEAPRRTRRNALKKEVSVHESEERETENLDRKNRTSKRSRGHATEKEALIGENGTVREIVDETGINNKQEVSKNEEAPRRTRRNSSKNEVSVQESEERETENLARKNRTSKRSRGHATEKEAPVGENGTVPEIVDETGAKNNQEEVSKNEEALRRTRWNASKKEVSVQESEERETENLARKNRTSKRSRGIATEKEAPFGENVTQPEVVDDIRLKNKHEAVSKTEEEAPRRTRRIASKKEVSVVEIEEKEAKNSEIVCNRRKQSRRHASEKQVSVRGIEISTKIVAETRAESKREKEEVSKIEEVPGRIVNPTPAETPYAHEKNASHKGEISPLEEKKLFEVTQSEPSMDQNDTGLRAEAKQEEMETGDASKVDWVFTDGGSDDRNEILTTNEDERNLEEEITIVNMKNNMSESKLYQAEEEEAGDSKDKWVPNARGSHDGNKILVEVEDKPIASEVERIMEEENAVELLKDSMPGKLYQPERETGDIHDDQVFSSKDENEILVEFENKSTAAEVKSFPEEEVSVETTESSKAETELYQSDEEEEPRGSSDDRVLSFNDRGGNDGNEILVEVENETIPSETERAPKEQNAVEAMKSYRAEAKPCHSEETGDTEANRVVSFNDCESSDGSGTLDDPENKPVTCEVARTLEDENACHVTDRTAFSILNCSDLSLKASENLESTVVPEKDFEGKEGDATISKAVVDAREIQSEFESPDIKVGESVLQEETTNVETIAEGFDCEEHTINMEETAPVLIHVAEEGREIGETVSERELGDAVSMVKDGVSKTSVYFSTPSPRMFSGEKSPENKFFGTQNLEDVEIAESSDVGDEVTGPSPAVAQYGQEKRDSHKEEQNPDLEKVLSEVTKSQLPMDQNDTGHCAVVNPYQPEKETRYAGTEDCFFSSGYREINIGNKIPAEIEDNHILEEEKGGDSKLFQSEDIGKGNDILDEVEDKPVVASEVTGIPEENVSPFAEGTALSMVESLGYTVAPKIDTEVKEVDATVSEDIVDGSRNNDGAGQDGSENEEPDIKVEETGFVLMPVAEEGEISETFTGFEREDLDINAEETVSEIESEEPEMFEREEVSQIHKTVSGTESENPNIELEEATLEEIEHVDHEEKKISMTGSVSMPRVEEKQICDTVKRLERENHEIIWEEFEFECEIVQAKADSQINKTISGSESENSNIEVEEAISEEIELEDFEVTEMIDAASTIPNAIEDNGKINGPVQEELEPENKETDEIVLREEAKEGNEPILESMCEEDGYAGIKKLFETPNSKSALDEATGSAVAEGRENKDTILGKLEYEDSSIGSPEEAREITALESKCAGVAALREAINEEINEICSLEEAKEANESIILECSSEEDGYAGIQKLFQTPINRALPDDQGITECSSEEDGYAGIQKLFQTPINKALLDDQGVAELREAVNEEIDEICSLEEAKEANESITLECSSEEDGFAGIQRLFQTPNNRALPDDQGVAGLREAVNEEIDEICSLEEAKEANESITQKCSSEEDGFAGIQKLFQTPNNIALPDDQGKPGLNKANDLDVLAEGRENKDTVSERFEHQDLNMEDEGTNEIGYLEEEREITVSVPESKCTEVADLREADNEETDEIGSPEEGKTTNESILECNQEDDGYAGMQSLFQTPNRALPDDQGKPVLNKATGSEVVAKGSKIRDPVSERLKYEDEGTDKICSPHEAREIAVSVPKSKCKEIAELEEPNIADFPEEEREIIVSVPEFKCAEVAEARESNIEDERTDKIGSPEVERVITVSIPESKCAEVSERSQAGIIREEEDDCDQGKIFLDLLEQTYNDLCLLQQMESQDEHEQESAISKQKEEETPIHNAVSELHCTKDDGVSVQCDACKEESSEITETVFGELVLEQVAVTIPEIVEDEREISGTVLEITEETQQIINSVTEETNVASNEGKSEKEEEANVGSNEGKLTRSEIPGIVEHEGEINEAVLEIKETQEIVKYVTEEANVASNEGKSEEQEEAANAASNEGKSEGEKEDDILSALRELFEESEMNKEMLLPGRNGEVEEDPMEKICALLKRVGISSARRESIRIIKTLKTPSKTEKNSRTPFKSLLLQRLASEETRKENITPDLIGKSRSHCKLEKSGNMRRRALENLQLSNNNNDKNARLKDRSVTGLFLDRENEN